MKKLFLFFLAILIVSFDSAFAQTLMDYVSVVKEDTLVIKDYSEINNQPNSLYWALTLDTINVPAGRVYELKAGGLYPLSYIATSSAKHPTVIVGSNPAMVVNNKNAASSPPLICTDNSYLEGACGIYAGGDLTIRNCELVCTANDNRAGVVFTFTKASNLHLIYDNCLFEHCAHWFVYMYNDSNQNVTFRNCYFVNMNGQPCRRDGGVFISFKKQDTLLVENCTHIMAQGHMYKFEIYFYPHDYQFKRIIFNHNTFVNCAGTIFMNPGYQSNVSLTNNLFVNCNLQSYGGISVDSLEQDKDGLPMGLVNVYPDSVDVVNNTPRKFLCLNNLVYWDPSLSDMESILNTNAVNGVTNWQPQMVIMNSRTDSMFKHIGRYNTTPYSYLYSDTWKNKMPHFTNPQNLFNTQLENLKTFALATVDLNSNAVLPDWRLINTDTKNYVHPDWPIPVDLSYSDDDLLIGGISGFPIGDLNWFRTQKEAWLTQRTTEYVNINNILNGGSLGISIQDKNNMPADFRLQQNYPNPFNPNTTISFSLLKGGYVTLKVYDILGKEVAILLNGYKTPRTYDIKFDGKDLESGIYFYRLNAFGINKVRKMVLVK